MIYTRGLTYTTGLLEHPVKGRLQSIGRTGKCNKQLSESSGISSCKGLTYQRVRLLLDKIIQWNLRSKSHRTGGWDSVWKVESLVRKKE